MPRDCTGTGAGFDAAYLMGLREVARHAPDLTVPAADRPGIVSVAAPGSGSDIREIRPYVEGDPLRSIDAAATARRGELHVRSFHDERERIVLLVADFRRPMLWGTRRRFRSVAAAEALAIAGWRVVDGGGAVALAIIDDRGLTALRPRMRVAGMAAVAEALAHGHAKALAHRDVATDVPPLGAMLGRAAKGVTPGSTVLCATCLDHPGPDLEATVASLARRGRMAMLLLRDAFERNRPPGRFSYFSEEGAVRRGRIAGQADHLGGWIERLRAVRGTVGLLDTDAENLLEGLRDGPG